MTAADVPPPTSVEAGTRRGLRKRLIPDGRRLAWAVWAATVVLAACHAAVFFRGSSHQLLDADGQLQDFPLITLGGLVGVTVGALVVNRHPRHVVGWLFLIGYAVTVVGIVTADYGRQAPPGGATTADHIANWIGIVAGAQLVIPIFIFIALLFPDGHLPSPRWKVAAWVNGLNAAATAVVAATVAGLPTRAPPEAELVVSDAVNVAVTVMLSIMILMMFVATASLVVRLRSADGDRRRQILWLLVAVAYFALGVAGVALQEPLDSIGIPVWSTQLVLFLGPSAIPLAAGVAIFRYRLYDIEVVVNRALVLGGLVGFAAVAYIGLVVGVGSLIGHRSGGSLGLTLLTTAAVALAFQPLRRQAHRLADRIVYGPRAAPYEVLAQLAQTMADAVSVADVLPRTAAAAVHITGGATARARVYLPDGGSRSATWPAGADVGSPAVTEPPTDAAPARVAAPAGTPPETQPTDTVVTQVRHYGEVVGDVAVATLPGRPLSKAHVNLLHDLALASGAALHNVRLTVELQRRVEQAAAQGNELRESRRRIMTSRDEERQLLEEEIDAHTTRRLRAVDAQLDDAERLVLADSDRAAAALSAAEAATTDALKQLRDLAGGVYPALLADRGVVAAVEARLRRGAVPGRVRIDDGPPPVRFAAATEAAIYFCCAEIIEGRSRFANPGPLAVRIRTDGGVVLFEVTSAGTDGMTWLDERRMLRIRDRVEAFGCRLHLDSDAVSGQLPAHDPA